MKIGLNVGSGQRPFKSTEEVEWINIDSQSKWLPDLILSGDNLHGYFENDSVDYVVLHHVLEHFGCGEGAGLIDEAFRVLKIGGRLYVTVPDMVKLANGWHKGMISTQLYMTNVYGAYMGHEDDRHKWGFDRASLSLLLHGGREWAFVQTPIAWIPPGADIARDWWILEAEAAK